jgi:hypothetical protein
MYIGFSAFPSRPTFSWTFVMAYSKAKLKSNGDVESPCFRPFGIGKVGERNVNQYDLHYRFI